MISQRLDSLCKAAMVKNQPPVFDLDNLATKLTWVPQVD
jgi:hypothetical protein